MTPPAHKFIFNWRHLNKLRWLSLSIVFLMLIAIPFLHLYQTFLAAHAYDLLHPSEKTIFDTMELISAPFVSEPETDLDGLKGTTWSGTLFGISLSDPLAVIGQITASGTLYWPFILTALIPILLTLILGRFFCGWICPATFLYELNTSVGVWLQKHGIQTGRRKLSRTTKYVVLAMGLLLAPLLGTVAVAAIYPPAIIGREIYYAIALNGFGIGAAFFAATLLFDLMVARRGFCRYLCPGGALYSLLGRYRIVRIQRVVERCNDCAKCTAVCEFGLDPLRDGFGQECNNCTACIAVCPTEALNFKIAITDQPDQGPGHLGRQYRKEQDSNTGAQDAA